MGGLMGYKSIGQFDTETLYEIYDDLTEFFEKVNEDARDLTVVEVGMPDEPDAEPELWHEDYSLSEGAWVEGGTFEDRYCAADAADAFPDGDAVAVYDYADLTAKLMVRDSGSVAPPE